VEEILTTTLYWVEFNIATIADLKMNLLYLIIINLKNMCCKLFNHYNLENSDRILDEHRDALAEEYFIDKKLREDCGLVAGGVDDDGKPL